jgi:hypothetical protein
MSKIEFNDYSSILTRITIIRKVPKGIYLTKSQEAFGKAIKELDYYGLLSITQNSNLKDNIFYHIYELTFQKNPKYMSDFRSKVRLAFSSQDWGIIKDI